MLLNLKGGGQYSDADIARILNEAGYRRREQGKRALALFSKGSVRDLLRNRFYLGEVQYKKQWHPGQHEPIVSEELFDRCQKARETKTATPGDEGSSRQPRLRAVRTGSLRPMWLADARQLDQDT